MTNYSTFGWVQERGIAAGRRLPHRSSVFLLAPLLGEVCSLPSLAQPRPPACPTTSEGLLQHFHWVADHAPAFRVSGGQVDCLQEALERSREERMAPDLKVSILLDYTRGSRGCNGGFHVVEEEVVVLSQKTGCLRGSNPNVERSRGSSVFLLAPLLGEVCSLPSLAQPRPPACPTTSEGLLQHFHWVADHAPAFRVSGGQANIKTAKRRVVMASLYLGTGPLEQELVDCLQEALERSREERMAPDLKVSILLDYTRGSRGKKNSRSMLLPLLQRFPGQMHVSLYHTPDLRGVLKTLIPERFNETIGLQHMKVYVFDDSLIISGANLSDSYFTNRQDRYILLRDCAELADFFSELVGAVGDVSLQLQPDDTVQVKEGMVHPYKDNHSEFCTAASKRIMQVVARSRQQLSASTTEDTQRRQGPGDTLVFPLVQMKPLGIGLDETVTMRLLTEAGDDSRVFLASGYFNLTRAYMELVLGTRADYRILLASPEVNGFFGAKGVAGAIPAAYIHIARQFYSKVCRRGQQNRIRLHEYIRRDWTFHAKGRYLSPYSKYCSLE
ncbi:UNVERIFIED_CONTAM: hypothetical protein FKN15_024186 [Acipenser sinensis]